MPRKLDKNIKHGSNARRKDGRSHGRGGKLTACYIVIHGISLGNDAERKNHSV